MNQALRNTNPSVEERIRVVVADDEALARRRMIRLLRAEPDAELVGVCANGTEALQTVRETRPDLLLLDVQMPGADGLSVLRAMPPAERPVVIFITAFDQYAVEAFEIRALDYLLKPFNPDRFHAAFSRVREELQRRARLGDADANGEAASGEVAMAPATGRYLDRLMLRSGGRVFFVKTNELDWIEADDNYVRLHRGNEVHLVRGTLTAIEARLDPALFSRIHRSAIVNLDRVQEMYPGVSRSYVVVLRDGTRLKLSPWYRERLESRMRPPD
jgi:two-component system LytT family response regulator